MFATRELFLSTSDQWADCPAFSEKVRNFMQLKSLAIDTTVLQETGSRRDWRRPALVFYERPVSTVSTQLLPFHILPRDTQYISYMTRLQWHTTIILRQQPRHFHDVLDLPSVDLFFREF